MPACAVLHVTSIPGGGVDRHVRDIAAAGLRPHYTWHVAEGVDVIERPDAPRYLPVAANAAVPHATDFLRTRGVGVLHLHSLSRPARARASAVASALGIPTIVTLHDVLFLGPARFELAADAAPDAAWLEEVAPVLRSAASVLAPSKYIAELARRHCGLEPSVVPNGIEVAAVQAPASARPAFAAASGKRVVAVLGALGPHKGSRTVEALARRLAGSGTVLVVIGYTDAQAWPGWFDDALFIHGPYEDTQVGSLLHAYGAELVLFPNPVPESFSYALSEAWAARVPVLVPPEGALGDRVREHGGGWLLPADFDAARIEEKLRFLATEAGLAEHARVKSSLDGTDTDRLPHLDAMNVALEDFYRRFGIDPAAPIDPLSTPAQSLLAAQLDSRIFRRELVVLAEALGQARQGPDAERRAARKFEAEARSWIAKLETDVAVLQSQLREEVARRERAERTPLRAALRTRIAALVPAGLRRALRGRRD
jgi:glycosyltransferase involved in cell wall biosynthesis